MHTQKKGVVTLGTQKAHKTQILFFKKYGYDGTYTYTSVEQQWSRLGQVLYTRGREHCGFSSAKVRR